VDALFLTVVEKLGSDVLLAFISLFTLFDVAYEGLLGWSSTWLTAGVVLKRESANSFSRFLMAKLETPMFFTRPDSGSFWSSAQVSLKSQSGRCFLRSSGSLDEGQCCASVNIVL
jgi:hypothetical protein